MTSTSSASEFIQRSISFREEGRFDEALMAARRATDLDPEDANGWWQMSHAAWRRDGAVAAIPHLQKTVELAPGFADGWHRLGGAYKANESLDDAIESWERASELEDDRDDTLQELVEAYGKREDEGDDEKRFEALKSLETLGRVSDHDWNLLGIGYYNRKQHQRAIQCYRRYATETGSHIAFYNLGLALNSAEVQQRTDAVDAWRRSLSRAPEYESASQRLASVVPKAVELSQRVLAGRRVFLSQDEWYAHYVNPYELLWLMGDEVDLASLEIKAIQKAKKKLLQEIELEDGAVEWMPGLKIDKSRAIKIADELLDDKIAPHHQIVALDRELCSFLTRGDIAFFLVKPENSQLDLLDQFDREDNGFAAWISKQFAPQLDLVLSKAIEARDVNAIEALLSGRRLVIPEHEDRCFEGAQRQVVRMLEPLRAASQDAEKVKPTKASIQAILDKDNLGRIVAVLPQYFQDVQTELARLIRSLSIKANNDHGDSEGAKEILAIGLTLSTRSPALRHQMEEDGIALDDLIKEQSKNDASLVLGGQTYSITKNGVAFGPKKIAVEDVAELRWGTVYVRDARGQGAKFNIDIFGKNGVHAQLGWTSYDEVDKQHELFKTLSGAALHYLMPAIMERLGKDLEAGRSLRIGSAVCSKQGIHFTISGWINDKTYICPWSRLKATIENGDLILVDPTERKARVQLPLHATNNAFALYFIINAYQDQ